MLLEKKKWYTLTYYKRVPRAHMNLINTPNGYNLKIINLKHSDAGEYIVCTVLSISIFSAIIKTIKTKMKKWLRKIIVFIIVSFVLQ